MTEDPGSARFETEQLPAFLDHIARREKEELERLRREYRSAARAVRTQARHQARQYHRRVCGEARTRIESDYARELSRARNRLRRRRWEALRKLHERAHDKIWAYLCERWADPASQLSWCRYWLRQCDKLQNGDGVEVRVSGDVHASTSKAIEQWIAAGDRPAALTVDESLDAGILIHHDGRSIDGSLATQLEHLSEAVHHELAAWLHEDADEEAHET